MKIIKTGKLWNKNKPENGLYSPKLEDRKLYEVIEITPCHDYVFYKFEECEIHE